MRPSRLSEAQKKRLIAAAHSRGRKDMLTDPYASARVSELIDTISGEQYPVGRSGRVKRAVCSHILRCSRLDS